MMVSLAKWSRIMALLMAAMLLFANAVRADDDEGGHGRVPLPAEIEGKGERCVQPEDVMRRDHMKYILHQRDETMHQGIRTKQYSLKECINCHVEPGDDGAWPSIASKDHFCNSCHSYAAVKIDCFECHATHPGGKDAQATAATSPLQQMARTRTAGGTGQ